MKTHLMKTDLGDNEEECFQGRCVYLKIRVWEVAEQLRTLTDFAKVLSSVPSTHMVGLSATLHGKPHAQVCWLNIKHI